MLSSSQRRRRAPRPGPPAARASRRRPARRGRPLLNERDEPVEEDVGDSARCLRSARRRPRSIAPARTDRDPPCRTQDRSDRAPAPHRHHSGDVPQCATRGREVPVEDRDRLAARNTTFSGQMSLWQTTARRGSASRAPRKDEASKPPAASCNRRCSRATLARAASVIDHAGNGGSARRPGRTRTPRRPRSPDRADSVRHRSRQHAGAPAAERRRRKRACGPANRVADPHDLAEVRDPAGERLFLGAHGGRIAWCYSLW